MFKVFLNCSRRGVETTLSRGGIFTIFVIPLKNIVMSDSEKIRELEAMIVHLTKRIEKLEGRSRLAGLSSYLTELRREAQKLLQYG